MPKNKKNRKNHKNRQLSNLKFFKYAVATIIVVAVSLVGSYAVLHSHAEEANIQHFSMLYGGAIGDAMNNNGHPRPIGSTWDIPIRGYGSGLDVPSQIVLLVAVDGRRLEQPSYSCDGIFKCSLSAWTIPSDQAYEQEHLYHTGYEVCVSLPAGYNDNSFTHVLTMHFKAKTDMATESAPSWLQLWETNVVKGDCQTNPTSIGSRLNHGRIGTCGYSYSAVTCEDGGTGLSRSNVDGSNGDKDNTKQGQADANNTTKGTTANNTKTKKAGGASGGAMATTQSDQANSIPSSGAQSTEDRTTTINPSPFYDGKQYAAGSDATEVLGSINVVGKKVQVTWLIVAICAAALLTSGLYFWRKTHKR